MLAKPKYSRWNIAALGRPDMECPRCQSQIDPHVDRCASCGELIPAGQYLLEESGVVPSATDYTSTTPLLEPSPISGRTATLGDRFIAFALDTIFIVCVCAVLDAWVFMRWSVIAGPQLNVTWAALLIALALTSAISFAYVWLLEAVFGATLGKAIVGIRVIRTNGRSALAASAIRNLFRLVDGLGFYLVGVLVAGCSRFRQRLGDICAGTAVVEAEFGFGMKAVAVLMWIAMFVGAGWAVPRICAETSPANGPRYLNQIVVQVGRNEECAYVRVARFRMTVQLGTDSEP
jgi:uncharacterized RDD family membrane protein YckC